MTFSETFAVRRGDNLTSIGLAYGFENPGPIWNFPKNKTHFANRSADLIRPGEKFQIPYHPDLLRKIIATSRHLGVEVSRTATLLIKQNQGDKRELESFLMLVDAANFLANVGIGIGSLIAAGAKGGTITAKEALIFLAESRANITSNITTLSVPAPEAPKRDFKFFVRHALGPWNPSYWVSVYAACSEGDINIYLYGADAIAHKNRMQLQQQANADIAKLNKRILEAQIQLRQPFYSTRI